MAVAGQQTARSRSALPRSGTELGGFRQPIPTATADHGRSRPTREASPHRSRSRSVASTLRRAPAEVLPLPPPLLLPRTGPAEMAASRGGKNVYSNNVVLDGNFAEERFDANYQSDAHCRLPSFAAVSSFSTTYRSTIHAVGTKMKESRPSSRVPLVAESGIRPAFPGHQFCSPNLGPQSSVTRSTFTHPSEMDPQALRGPSTSQYYSQRPSELDAYRSRWTRSGPLTQTWQQKKVL